MRKRFVYGAVAVALILIAVATAFSSYARTSCAEYKLGETVVFRVDPQKTFCFCCCCGSACAEVGVLGWRVVDCSGRTIYAVVHDVAVPVSAWEARWKQIDSSAAFGYAGAEAAQSVVTLGYSQSAAAASTTAEAQAAAAASATAESWATASSEAGSSGSSAASVQAAAGYYTLYVDTTAGTLSRCLKLYDPCCWCRGTCCSRQACCFGSCCSYKETQTIKACCCRISLELDVVKPKCCFWLFSPCCCGCP